MNRVRGFKKGTETEKNRKREMGQSDGLNYICPQAVLLQDSLCPKITSQSWFELTKQSSKAHREEKTATR